MKKLLACLFMLLLATPAMASTVTIGLSQDAWTIFGDKLGGNHPQKAGAGPGWVVGMDLRATLRNAQRQTAADVKNALLGNSPNLTAKMQFAFSNSTQYVADVGGGSPQVTIMLRLPNAQSDSPPDYTMYCMSNRQNIKKTDPNQYVVISCPVSKSGWKNDAGQTPSDAAWANMLTNAGSIGIAFGGNQPRGGVKNIGDAGNIFLRSYEISN